MNIDTDLFTNVRTKINDCNYELTKKYINEKQYFEAIQYANQVTDKNDISQLKNDIYYNIALQYLDAKQYSDAVVAINQVTSNAYENLQETKNKIHYEYGKSCLANQDYSTGIQQLKLVQEYYEELDDTFFNNIYFQQAEYHLSHNNLKDAKSIYDTLPTTFEYNGLKVSDRKKLLNKFASIINATGTNYATKSYCESRNVWKYDGRWKNWYLKEVSSSEYIETSLTLNKDETVTLNGTVYFYAYDDFSTLAEYCNPKIVSKKFKIENISSPQLTYEIDEYTKLLFSNGKFSISYSKKDDYSTNFYNLYNSSVTY